MLCDIMSITCKAAGYYLQSLLVQWLRANVNDRCADWFKTHWTGPVKGRYLLGSGGVGLVSNNQSLESSWRWDRHACTSGSPIIILHTPSKILHTLSKILHTPSKILHTLQNSTDPLQNSTDPLQNPTDPFLYSTDPI